MSNSLLFITDSLYNMGLSDLLIDKLLTASAIVFMLLFLHASSKTQGKARA